MLVLHYGTTVAARGEKTARREKDLWSASTPADFDQLWLQSASTPVGSGRLELQSALV